MVAVNYYILLLKGGFIELPNYIRKSELIENGMYKLYVDIRKSIFLNGPKGYGFKASQVRNPYTKYSYDDACELDANFRSNPLFKDDWEENYRIYHSTVSRNTRLKDRISSMLSEGQCLFVTLTFRDNVFETTTSDTRHQAVKRFLGSFNTDYVANIDYGSQNGREHYHAVILLDRKSFKYDLWYRRYGAVNVKTIVNSVNSPTRLGKYISKLTNHAIKVTCRGNRIIYSRRH